MCGTRPVAEASEEWTIPEWMEPYLSTLRDGDSAGEVPRPLLVDVMRNPWIAPGLVGQVRLLERLHKAAVL